MLIKFQTRILGVLCPAWSYPDEHNEFVIMTTHGFSKRYGNKNSINTLLDVFCLFRLLTYWNELYFPWEKKKIDCNLLVFAFYYWLCQYIGEHSTDPHTKSKSFWISMGCFLSIMAEGVRQSQRTTMWKNIFSLESCPYFRKLCFLYCFPSCHCFPVCFLHTLLESTCFVTE